MLQWGSLQISTGSLDWIFYYSPRCGAFGRIENVRLGSGTRAVVEVHRSNSGAHVSNGSVGETVDAGLNFAYTKIANNLSGRVAQVRAVVRGPGAFASSGRTWYQSIRHRLARRRWPFDSPGRRSAHPGKRTKPLRCGSVNVLPVRRSTPTRGRESRCGLRLPGKNGRVGSGYGDR